MNKRKLAGALLGVSILCSMEMTAFAAEKDAFVPAADLDAPAENQQSIPERVLSWGKIQEIEKEADSVVSLTITCPADNNSELVLRIDGKTIALDSTAGKPADLRSLKAGDDIYAFHSAAMTLSLPPQTYAEAIVWNVPQDGACAMLHTVEKVEKTENGISILTDGGSLYVFAGKDADVSPLYTKDIVTLDDIRAGDRVFAWYAIVLESYPGQAYTDKLVRIPAQTEAEGALSAYYSIVLDGDMVLEQKAETRNGVVTVPLRAVAETLGCTVEWNAARQTATITSPTRTMTVTLGEDAYGSSPVQPDGQVRDYAAKKLGCAPYVDGACRMWVPAEAFAVMGGFSVDIGAQVSIAGK